MSYTETIPYKLGIPEARSKELHRATLPIFQKHVEGDVGGAETLMALSATLDALGCTPIERLHEIYHFGKKCGVLYERSGSTSGFASVTGVIIV